MRRFLWLLALTRVAAAACPFSSMTASTILVADSAYCGSALTCIVHTANCTLVNSAFPIAEGSTYEVTAVGNMVNYKWPTLSVGNVASVDITAMILPNSLNTLYLEGIGALKPFPSTPLWPPNLTKMSLATNNITHFTNLDLSSLKYLWGPRLISANLLGDRSIMANPVTEFANVSLSAAALTYLYGAPELFTEGGSVVPSCIRRMKIPSLSMPQSTYNALNGMHEIDIKGNLVGYDAAGAVTNGTSGCASQGGVIRYLWSVAKGTTLGACVVPGVGAVIGIGAAVVVTVLAIGIYFYIRRKRRGKLNAYGSAAANSPPQTKHTEDLGNDAVSARSTSRHLEANGNFDVDFTSLRLLRLEPADLRVTSDRPISSGAFGEVWHGTYGSRSVAIKRTKDKTAKGIEKFAAEILLMSRLECPYVVSLVGASWTRPANLECVVEYMDLGDLRTYLAARSPEQFTWEEKHTSIMSVVQGLVYLHTFDPPIIHRDLKSRNVLLDSKKGTKITDFGESREMDETTLTNAVGTVQWMAPEICAGHDYSTAADVYSFGVLLSEYSTHQVPYTGMVHPRSRKLVNQQYIMTQILAGQLMPAFETVATPAWVLDLACQCLAHNPDHRPTMLKQAACAVFVTQFDLNVPTWPASPKAF
ncbi:protein kinase [Achlya hypogyna]|uniref:Protein kinase n=1 Tax=Achlya hypogyna TaxID=1202772 RepID=A0A1V9YG61_ACHHY|nr:protein kinase [Achlya hypogyna]